jgi:hypothetical protein
VRACAEFAALPAIWGKPPRESFVMQLHECREAWRRHHPQAPRNMAEDDGHDHQQLD